MFALFAGSEPVHVLGWMVTLFALWCLLMLLGVLSIDWNLGRLCKELRELRRATGGDGGAS